MSRTHSAEHAVWPGSVTAGDFAQRLCGEAISTPGFDAGAVAAIVDEAKQEGLIDQVLTTSSIVCLCRALGLGAHALEFSRPNGGGAGAAAWNAVMESILEALAPDRPAAPQPTA